MAVVAPSPHHAAHVGDDLRRRAAPDLRRGRRRAYGGRDPAHHLDATPPVCWPARRRCRVGGLTLERAALRADPGVRRDVAGRAGPRHQPPARAHAAPARGPGADRRRCRRRPPRRDLHGARTPRGRARSGLVRLHAGRGAIDPVNDELDGAVSAAPSSPQSTERVTVMLSQADFTLRCTSSRCCAPRTARTARPSTTSRSTSSIAQLDACSRRRPSWRPPRAWASRRSDRPCACARPPGSVVEYTLVGRRGPRPPAHPRHAGLADGPSAPGRAQRRQRATVTLPSGRSAPAARSCGTAGGVTVRSVRDGSRSA